MDLLKTMTWRECPQRDLSHWWEGLIMEWAGYWDKFVFYVCNVDGLRAPTVKPGFCRAWARYVLNTAGTVPAGKVLMRLRYIRKEADITPKMAERWNEVLLPFIQASELALEEALGR